jgi:ABC-type glycerol-3-phosphate transport system substrate-binding protein
LDELTSYTGPDRQKIIIEGAKAEGKVVWYTSLSGNYREIVDAFKKKYPEIQLKFTAPAAATWRKGCLTKLELDAIWQTLWKPLPGP